MRALFYELPEACDNTLWVAERADVTIELGKPKLPAFPLPEGFASSDEYLRFLSFREAEARYGAPVPPMWSSGLISSSVLSLPWAFQIIFSSVGT